MQWQKEFKLKKVLIDKRLMYLVRAVAGQRVEIVVVECFASDETGESFGGDNLKSTDITSKIKLPSMEEESRSALF